MSERTHTAFNFGADRMDGSFGNNPQEREPLVKHPIFITGGAGSTGSVIAEKFAREGYPLIIGTRSQDKFNALSAKLEEGGLATPRPFIADITHKDSVDEALGKLNLGTEPVHFFSLAAEGMRGLGKTYMQILMPLRRAAVEGTLTREDVIAAGRVLKDIVSSFDAQHEGMTANTYGPLSLLTALREQGNIRSDSKIVTLSSSISHDTDPGAMGTYPGPWFYVPVGLSKQYGVLGLSDNAKEAWVEMIDFVSPEIEGTQVAKFIDGFVVPIIAAVDTRKQIAFPKVTKEAVANAMLTELTKKRADLPLQRTVFIEESGPRDTRPTSWGETSLIPYL